MQEPTLNVIYTPGTVRYLSLLIWSMLDYSSCRFRLVANGCGAEEMVLLRQLAERSPRLSCLALPTTSMMPHGQALNYLQAGTEGDRFAFLDSDICAVGPLPAQLFELCPGQKMCCCYPATVYRKRGGRSQPTLGHQTCTFLAVYDNKAVRKFRESTGLGFDKYLWPEIPRRHQEHLIRMKLKRRHYNTAQLLSLLILEPDEKPGIARSQELVHIGGFSWWTARETTGTDSRPATTAVQPWTGPGLKELIVRLLPRNAKEFRKKRKQDVSRYFAALLDALFAGDSLPELPHTDDAAIDRRRAQQATHVITALFEKHGAAMPQRMPSPVAVE